LDNLLSELGINDVDLIKIDTEGSEYHILRGAIQTLKRSHPVIIVEVHSHLDRHRVAHIMEKLGFRIIYEKVNFPEGFLVHDFISVLYFI